jgi:uncharacterized cupin superfamily protein
MTSKTPISQAGEKMRDAFREDGFLPPVPLFTRPQCQLVLNHIRDGHPPDPYKWTKGQAVSDRLIFDLATRSGLLAKLRLLLGNDVVLWGANWLLREPNQVHPWHSDIECSSPDGGFVSVWVGIENTSRESALQMIRSSHRIGKTIQEVAHNRGFRRGQADAATVLKWAQETIAEAEFVQPEMRDGDALFFDGRLWHGSENTRAEGTRIALLFQYAVASKPVRMPDYDRLDEWPFRYQHTRVPILSVSGNRAANNAVVPLWEDIATLRAQFHQIEVARDTTELPPWKPYPLFEGETSNVSRMSVHYSVLAPGNSPHPPHAHSEEEILVIIDGEAELVIGRNRDGSEPRRERLQRGAFVYYPAFQYHTIRNAGDRPVTYLMFKWVGQPHEVEAPQETLVLKRVQSEPATGGSFATKLLFEGPTHYLAKLHAHITELQPRGGYSAHIDSHDVAMVVLSGTISTAGRRAVENNVIYFPAGEIHGMENSGPASARYLVFEFHRGLRGADGEIPQLRRPAWQKAIRRGYRRVRQKAASTYLWKRLRPIYRKFR